MVEEVNNEVASETKVCVKCNEDKPLDCFQIRSDTKKHRTDCKDCRAKHNKDFRLNYKKGEGRLKKKIEANKSLIKKCTKCGEEKSLDCFQVRTDVQAKTYRNDCITCRNEYVGNFKRTSEKSKKRQNERQKERRKDDPAFLMNQRIRSRLGSALRANGTKKTDHLVDIIGCTIPFFKDHIEKLFKPGMSWDEKNFVIDHIIPVSYFDLTSVEEQKICFHYTNMQPLTFTENAKKSDKLLPEYSDYLKQVNIKLSKVPSRQAKAVDGRENNSGMVIILSDTTIDNPQPSP